MSIQAPDFQDLQLPAAMCALLCDALPRAASLDAALSVIEDVRQAMLGDGLLTVNKVSTLADGANEFELQRLWSSNPQAYPVAGLKRKTLTSWSRQLLLRGEVYVGEGDEALAGVFDDHARITALGLHKVVNVPLLVRGRCGATFNVLGCQTQWLPHDIALIRLLSVLATPWIVDSAKQRHVANPLLCVRNAS